MSPNTIPHRRAKMLVGAVVFAALAAAAAFTIASRRDAPTSEEGFISAADALPGFVAVIGYKFDGGDYSGQQGARVVTIDFVADPATPRETLLESMKSAGAVAIRAMSVYQRVIVTGYRSRAEFDAGLPFSARAVWLSAELAAPLDGWITMRLPDAARAPEKALEGIYSRLEVVSADGGRLTATIDLDTERLARPASDLHEIVATPLVNTYDYDNVFLRSPALAAIDLTVLKDKKKLARLAVTREGYARVDATTLRAALAKQALSVSIREFAYAAKYDEKGLFTPLLFDKVVTAEDKAALKSLEAERAAAEDAFYKGLFAAGTYESGAPSPQ